MFATLQRRQGISILLRPAAHKNQRNDAGDQTQKRLFVLRECRRHQPHRKTPALYPPTPRNILKKSHRKKGEVRTLQKVTHKKGESVKFAFLQAKEKTQLHGWAFSVYDGGTSSKSLSFTTPAIASRRLLAAVSSVLGCSYFVNLSIRIPSAVAI